MDSLTYKGRHDDWDPNWVCGPDNFGAFYIPVSAMYDEYEDKTVITFKTWTPDHEFDPRPMLPVSDMDAFEYLQKMGERMARWMAQQSQSE
ncbi:hypothetical protein HOT81_gp084 [Gordonia phage Fryberger]|uniref:Uncharacterized protein n=1 Tax=Gordonia phage Fryberger TaxID=2250392 RepID=A0A346FCN7_9CAUD|nr:hypothetical protein HOT81_gp084 [Gordonia phage Fryberger]AXN53501.1 hypothetical protein SEA_FRYBERGER_84 [Gordonia phage Fryberger]